MLPMCELKRQVKQVTTAPTKVAETNRIDLHFLLWGKSAAVTKKAITEQWLTRIFF